MQLNRTHTACLMSAVLACQVSAQSGRTDVAFDYQYQTNFGESIFVIGSAPELGGWDVRRALKLEGRDNPNWELRVAMPAGREFQYMYVLRQDAPGLLGNANNVVYLSSVMTMTPEAEVSRTPGETMRQGDASRGETASRGNDKAKGKKKGKNKDKKKKNKQKKAKKNRGKGKKKSAQSRSTFGPDRLAQDLAVAEQRSSGVVFESDFVDPVLHYRPLGSMGVYRKMPMTDIGNGLTPGDVKWAAIGLEGAPQGFEFFIDGAMGGFYPDNGVAKTELSEIYIRDGEVFNAVPPMDEEPPRLLPRRVYFSSILGESRGVRILLPRNYGLDPEMRYPVVYMHDGQALFGGNGSWRVQQNVTEQTELGNMREVIIVGIDNSGYDNRFRDYLPDGDGSTFIDGEGSKYAAFIREELKPIIDDEFLTIDDPAVTGTMGSSLGAVCAMYQGFEHGDVFKRVGAFSGAWPFSANFNQRLDDEDADVEGLRVYIDSGDAGPSSDNYFITSGVRDILLDRTEGAKFAIERNLRYRVGFGDSHEQRAWARRLPEALTFLYPATEDARGFEGLEVQLRGDVNSDGSVDAEDLQQFNRMPPMDIDNDGFAGTMGDYNYLMALVRTEENG
ncbi:MAG: alpha/beta hydrolase-fold protein [Planctomycetota bacterium]